MGSRPPVYFAVYDCGLATLPEAAETLTARRNPYCTAIPLNYTPEIAQFQRLMPTEVPTPEATLWAVYRVLAMCDLRAFALPS